MANPGGHTGIQVMPVRGDRTCPSFDEKDPRSLNRYFDDLESLFTKHSVANADHKERKELVVRYIPYKVEASWRTLEQFGNDANGDPFAYDKFKEAVYDFYPGVTSCPEWTMDDLDLIVNARVVEGPVKDINDYSRYYVEVRPIVMYLLGKNRINHIEGNGALARAIGPALREAIGARLINDVPNRAADTPYTFDQFHRAATYVLRHRNDDYDAIQWEGGASTVPPRAPSKPIIAPAPVHAAELSVPIKQEEMALSMAALISKEVATAIASAFPKATPPVASYPDRASARTPPPAFGGQRRDPAPRSTTPRRDCFYCGNEGCETKSCPEAAEDIAKKKIKRENGLLVMFDGSPIPYNIRGRTLREKVNIYCDTRRDAAPAAEQMMLELMTPDSDYVLVEYGTGRLSDDDTAALAALQLQMNELQAEPKKKPNLRFDGVEIIQRARGPANRRLAPPAGPRPATPPPPSSPLQSSESRLPFVQPRAPTPGPSGSCSEMQPPSALSVPANSPPAPTQAGTLGVIPIHPYSKARDATDNTKLAEQPAAPFRGVGGVLQPPAYRTESRLDDPAVVREVHQRIFCEATSNISPMELLAVSAPIQKMVHAETAMRRVPVSRPEASSTIPTGIPKPPVPASQSTRGGTVYYENVPEEASPSVHASYLADDEDSEDPIEGFTTDISDTYITAKDRHKIRALWCMVNETALVECILDGGSQIVAISEACCNRLRIPIDPRPDLPIQSANRAVDRAVSLAMDIPVQLPGRIVVYLQMFVVHNAAYNVLLGRPFETLLKVTIDNVGEDEQIITVHCPNTGAVARVATSARGEKRPAAAKPPMGFQA
ncbi:hypothetical protein LXA43DRAFT_1066884 [Ganoderma leucocontextum]|nr:hypothetical protein LXA43DRAFT_1066884 [Ganoderma leucocontextum]